MTIERLLQDPNIQAWYKVLIIDEAGMVSGRQMLELLQIAEQNSARIVFGGDTQQIQSVEACDALRILEKESRLKSVSLREVKRQTAAEYREAIQELRRNPGRGLERLDEIGAVRELPFMERPQAIARAYLDSAGKGQNALVVCATHDEIGRVTEAIRLERRKAGDLGKGAVMSRDVSLNWTTAQKSETRNFRPGQLLGFHRAVKGIAKNETVEVAGIEKEHLLVRNDRGRIYAISTNQVKAFDVIERKGIEIASSDRLMLTANCRTPALHTTNGEIVTVSRIDAMGRIHLKDGRTLPSTFRQFTHGYAVTAHRSQGKSVDAIIIAADGMKKEMFYVAASRGRRSAVVFTGDKQLLKDSIGCSAARQSASELARRANYRPARGIRRGLAAARQAMIRSARYFALILRRQSPKRVFERQPIMEKEYDHGISR